MLIVISWLFHWIFFFYFLNYFLVQTLLAGLIESSRGPRVWRRQPNLNWSTIHLFGGFWIELWIPILTDSELFQFSDKSLWFKERPAAVAIVPNVESLLLVSRQNATRSYLESATLQSRGRLWVFYLQTRMMVKYILV